MIHIIKNNKWVLGTSLISIALGVLTFFTFINQSIVELNDLNLQILLFIDTSLLILFFGLIFREIYKVLKEKRKGKLGSETSLRYISFFSMTTLLPSILITIFSLFLLNVVLQKYFEKKIKSVINNSAEVAESYVNQIRNSIEADISLMVLDVNNQSNLYYENPKRFLNLISSQRLLRRLDEVDHFKVISPYMVIWEKNTLALSQTLTLKNVSDMYVIRMQMFRSLMIKYFKGTELTQSK